jgi:ABC-type transporter Mla MlaB component
LEISGPITPADVVGLCERVRVRLESSDAEVLVCDVAAVTEPDVGTVDALARLQHTARRLGRSIRLRHPSRELLELLVFCGLEDVLPVGAGLGVEPRRQTEEREQARRIEERVERGDPTV